MFLSERSILVDVDSLKSVEEEEMNKFVKSFLLSMDIPNIESIWPDVFLSSAQDKLKLRAALSKYEIDVISDGDRGIKIFLKDELIAEWFKPNVILKKDVQATKKPKDQYYYELKIKSSSIFEE
jgi:hypothetical protein